jgi:cytochrome c5
MRLCLLALIATFVSAAPPDFVREVQPIFETRCLACHGAGMQSAGLRFDQAASALRTVKPGDSAGSLLFRKVSGLEKTVMPPSGARLSVQQIATLKSWIDSGAKWPENAVISTSKHWAFQPIARPAVPGGAASNPVDRFILARLVKEGVAASPEVQRATLIRRVTLDLTGLPPTPEETAAFLNDTRPDAYGRLVDRLLASPHYGEKWARMWLDLAHYADSDGYEKDLVRPYAWRYRDWVIDALNHDLAYDQFTIKQIAGDELPGATVDDRAATGFFRQTLTNREGGIDRKEDRFEQLIDRTGTLGTTWLGLTVRCAQCHNHKFDPITNKDYYQLMAYFNAAEESEVDAPAPGELGPFLARHDEYLKKRDAVMEEYHIAELQKQWEDKIRETVRAPGKNLDWDFVVTAFRALVERADPWIATPAEQRRERDNAAMTKYFLGNIGPDFSKDKDLAAKLKEARTKLDALDAEYPRLTEAAILQDSPGAGPQHIAIRGDYKQPGTQVEPGTPGFLPAPGKPASTRLQLAEWIMAPQNPLTARVAVNRLWQELFGRGIVATSDDFGTQGDRPSHPELLDWLATEFREGGWSQKQMIRLIVTSATYKQSSHARPDLEAKDPLNVLLARQSRIRLPAEEIRDEALSASGLLDARIFGPSVKPPQPAGVAELAYNNSVKWKESTGADKYRRGLYVHYQRTTPYPFLANFDEPDSTMACTRRRISNTPLQALNLLNDPVFYEAAEALAYRITHEAAGDFDARLDYAFALALSRKPSAHERARLEEYYKQPDGWLGVSRVLLNLDEFITRE